MRRWQAAAWVLGAVLGAAPAAGQDTGGYRGPENNGVFPADGLLKAWPHGGPKLLWKYPVDIGYAGATVAGDRVYIGGGRSTNYVYEFSLEGELRKRIATGSSVCHSGRFHGTRCQPLVVDEMVVVTTPNANIYGVDVARQVIRWKKNAWKDFGTGEGSQGWGMQETPMLDGEKVIFNAVSRNDETPPIVAIDIRSGQTVWEADPGKGRNYSVGSAHGAVFTHNGRRILAYPCWRGFLVLEAKTGKKLWEFPDPRGSQKELTPVYNNGYLLTAPQPKLCRMVKLSEDGSSFTPLWERPWRGMFSQAVILDGRVYLFGDAADEPRPPSIEGAPRPFPRRHRDRAMPALLCVDAGTGETIQHYPAAEPGHVSAADGMVYSVEKLRVGQGRNAKILPRVRLIRPCRAGFEITGEFIPELTDEEIALRDVEWEANASPTIAEGRLFLRYGPLMCFDLRADPPSRGYRINGGGIARFARPPLRWRLPADAAWTCRLPSANASPMALDAGRAYLLAGGELVCVDMGAGRIAWRAPLGRDEPQRPPPTPLVSEGLIYTTFHDGQVACRHADGLKKWAAKVEPSPSVGLASPLLCKDVLVVQGKDLVGLSARTGEVLWTVELPEGFPCGTPVHTRVNEYDGRHVVLLSCGMLVRAFDGRVYVRYNPKDRSGIPAVTHASPVVAGSRAYYCGNRVDGTACLSCFDLDVESRQFREQFRQATKRIPDVTFAGSPLVVDGLVYMLTSRQELAAFDAAGRQLWRQALVPKVEQDTPPPPTAELIAAGGYVFAVGLGSGDRVAVIRPGRTFEKLWDCLLPDGPVGLAFDRGSLYVRTGASLHCVPGAAPEAAQDP